jgi:phosphoadenosine phosphosulfate reductase
MFEEADPREVVAWAVRTFGQRLAFACSFGGASGMALLDMLVKTDPAVPVYYLDTGLLFPETYEHIRRASKHYGITPIAIKPELTLGEQAQAYGPDLWERDPDRCCELRKVEPQRAFLSEFSAWMTGVRRDQTVTRRETPPVATADKFGLVKINPLVNWTEQMVWAYIRAHGVPYNPLHDRGYPSIGCKTCTVAVRGAAGLRSGRWPGKAKLECGLHV